MTTIILIFLGWASIIPIIMTISNRIVYGPLLNDSEHLVLIEKKVKHDRKLNMFNPTILSSGNLPYVTTVVFSVFGKYYMNGIGVIPRWTKMHKLINKAFIEAWAISGE